MSSKNKKRNDVTTEIVVGAFMFIILVILLTVTVVISQNKLFRKSYSLTATFSNIGGLKEGEPIFLRGVKVGYVEQIDISEEKPGVDVKMYLTQPFKLYEDYEIFVEASSMLGGMRLVVDEGTPQLKELSEKDMTNLEGRPATDVLREAGKVIEMIRKSLVEDGTLDNLSEVTENLSEITAKIKNGEGTVGRLIMNDDLYAEAQELMENLSAASDDIKVVSKDARSISQRLAAGEGTLGKLLSKDEQAYMNLTNTLEQISLASTDARKIMSRLEKGEGTIGKLMSKDDQIYNDLKEAIASLKDVSKALSEEEGTVGALINSKTLYIKIESLVDEARATIDDFRETSPITTFSSVFFGAF